MSDILDRLSKWNLNEAPLVHRDAAAEIRQLRADRDTLAAEVRT